jgi:hypothetical protein
MVAAELAPSLATYERITKADLLAMMGTGQTARVPPEQFGLTHQDLRTIRAVFLADEQLNDVVGHAAGAVEGDIAINCCCCPCTCCCAAAVPEPVRPLS